jgi:hypothetical protein
MQLRSADEGSTVFYEVSLLSQFVVGADDSVSNAVTNTPKTISPLARMRNVVIYTKCIIHISSNYNHSSKLLTIPLLFHFLPFLLHILLLRFTSLENNSHGEDDHPNDHP